ncbi:B12-binding domain-containing radical SAM protein [Dethiosulfatarculus sandiegensis]|uniref:Uncharacterized protein n=1 Tax=Dethiosulfatarculus sandiegensis TaxID=1429043 RepID=A0A0D2HWE9_9BACT|nr:radical SAM protein [Dethiosulfatarculus sandiegensis]KIX14698.1 hypothetical protein X474_07315 [Dethiosulfatarculus sandiegensis]
MQFGVKATIAPKQKHQTDILFFFSPYVGHPMPHRFDINLGAAYLAAYLKQKGLTPGFYYGPYDNDPEFGQIMKHLARTTPFSLGFTVYGSNLPETAALCREIKHNYPNLPIIWGGPELRFSPKEILQNHAGIFDYAISGEGEAPLTELLKALQKPGKQGIEKIPGLTFFAPSSGQAHFNPHGKTLWQQNREQAKAGRSLDIYPSPYLSGIIPDNYFKEKPVVSILTSRGCPFRCLYCQFSAQGDHKLKFHSLDRVLAEIKYIHSRVLEKHPRRKEIYIMVYDEALTLSRKRSLEFFNRLLEQKFEPKVKLWVDTRADRVDKKLLALMQRAGAKKINFGLESADPLVLRKIQKISLDRGETNPELQKEKSFIQNVRKAVHWSKKMGMITSVSIITGLPGESMEQARRTVKFVQELEVDLYYHNYLNVLKGTVLAQKAAGLGYEPEKTFKGYIGKYGLGYSKAPFASRKIKPLKNAMAFRRDSRRFNPLLRGFFHAKRMAQLNDRQSLTFPFLVDVGQAPVNPRWLNRVFQELAGLSFSIFWPQKSSLNSKEYENLFHHLGLGNAAFYTRPNASSPDPRLRGREEMDHSTPYLMPCRKYPLKKQQNGRGIFLYLEEKQDLKVFENLLTRHLEPGQGGLAPEKAQRLNFNIFEACRMFAWAGPKCPAGAMTHLYTGPDRDLRPCKHFPALNQKGKIMGLTDMQAKVFEIQEKTYQKRGCHKCPVIEKCPQCVAPHPLTEEEYCSLQKNMHL